VRLQSASMSGAAQVGTAARERLSADG
jgi:hypothetical protein